MADNERKVTDLYSDKYGTITVSQINQISGESSITIVGGGYDPDCPPSSYLDLSSEYVSAKIKPFFDFPTLTTTDIDSDEWTELVETTNNKVVWIWGSLTKGGFGLVNINESGYVKYIISYGMYTREVGETTQGQIVYYSSGQQYTKNMLSEVMFCHKFFTNIWQVEGTYQGFSVSMKNPYYGGLVNCQMLTVEQQGQSINYVYGNVYTVDSMRVGLANNNTLDVLTTNPVGTARYFQTIAGDTFDALSSGGNYFPEEVIIEGWESLYGYGWTGGSDTDEENAGGGLASTGGGDGSFDNSCDVAEPTDDTQFTTDAINSGFVTIYNPTKYNVQAFCNYLFSSITEQTATALKKLIQNPLDYIVSLNMVHFSPNVNESQEIKFCGIGTGVSAPVVANQFKILDCGSVSIGEQFNSFLDYGGYSTIKIYLPYCGIFPISVNDVMGGTLKCQYIIDLCTGACIAQLSVTRSRSYVYADPYMNDTLLYEFTGNVFQQVPISATDYRGMIQGMMSVVSGGAQIASGNVMTGMGSVASGVMGSHPDIQHSGNASTSYGYMGHQKPYLILERPMQNLPNKFGEREGYVSNIYVNRLADLQGYCEVYPESFHTEYINCTDAERTEIESLIAGGFII